MKHDKKTLIGAGILALALIIAFVYAMKSKRVEAPLDKFTAPISSIIEAPKSRGHRKATPIEAMKASYTDSFMKFHGGNILQFDNNCQSHPFSLAVANGSEVLLDNRSDNAEVITIGENKYTLDPYGFQVITLNVPKIPETFTVDCKVAQNVSTIIVE